MSQDVAVTTLKVRPDVFFVRSDDGVWLRNNVGSFFIKGEQSYHLVRSLLGQLDGTRTVADVCAGMAPTQRAALQARLLEPLLRNGFLIQIRQESVPPWIAGRYGEHLAFLEQYVDAPLERLLRVRTRAVACLGSGLLLRAVAVALADLGFARVRLLAADTEADERVLREVVASVRQVDSGAEWEFSVRPSSSSLCDLVAAHDGGETQVAILATGAPCADVVAAAMALRARGLTVGVVAPVGGFLVAAPLIDDEPWCWECVHRSVVSEAPAAPAPPPAALAAFQVVQRVFCRLAGPPVPEDRHVTLVDARTLSIRVESPQRHAACRQHAPADESPAWLDPLGDDLTPVRPDIASSRDDSESIAVQDRIVETTAAWTHGSTGPLLSVGEEDLPQLPLAASRCRVTGPRNVPGTPDVRILECHAVAPREARNQVVLLALECLAEAAVRLNGRHDAVSIGAGWSVGEAIYRALATASLRSLAKCAAMPVRRGPIERAGSPLRRFLLDTLAQSGHDHGAMTVEIRTLSTGFVAARLLGSGEAGGESVGVDDAHAIDQALVDTVARRAGVADGATAYLAPPFACWPDALRTLLERAQVACAVQDARRWLPFVDHGARVVALELIARPPAPEAP